MRTNFGKLKLFLELGAFSFFLTACAPGPPPPLFPGFLEFIFGWLVVAAFFAVGIFLWQQCRHPQKHSENYLTDSLNALNERLKALEKRLQEMEQSHSKKGKS